jgi:hypothetical protein
MMTNLGNGNRKTPQGKEPRTWNEGAFTASCGHVGMLSCWERDARTRLIMSHAAAVRRTNTKRMSDVGFIEEPHACITAFYPSNEAIANTDKFFCGGGNELESILKSSGAEMVLGYGCI